MIKKSKIYKPKNQLFCDQKAITAIRMTFLSRDIYFHTPSGNQTKL